MSFSDIDPENGCGISWLWKLPDDHKLTPACLGHDQSYRQLEQGTQTLTASQVDEQLYDNMTRIAEDPRNTWEERVKLLAERDVFYRMARIWATTVRAAMWAELGPKVEIGPYEKSGETQEAE